MITSNNFQGQTSGTAASIGNSATSGTAFTGVFTNGGIITYDNSQGSMALQTAGLASSTCFVECTNFGSDVEISVAFDYYVGPAKTAARTLFQLRSASGIVMSVLRTTSDNLAMTDAGGATRWTSSTNLSTYSGDWLRIELQVLSDATAGTMQASLFPQSSTTTIEAGALITGRNTRGGAITIYRMGKADSSTDTQADWFDNVRSEDSVLKSIGPTPTPPTAMKQNTAEGGTNGVTVTTANSGGGSGDPFSQVTITGSASVIFSTANAAHGSQSYYISGISGDTGKLYLGNTAGAEASMRAYIMFSTLPGNAQTLFNVQNTSFAAMANVNITSANHLTITDSTGSVLFTSTNSVNASTWYRIELQVITGQTSITGTINFQYYLDDSQLAIETLTSNTANTTALSALRAQSGKLNSGATLNAYFDSLAYADNTSVPIGPYSSANSIPTCNAGDDMDGIEPWTTQVLAGSDNDIDGTVVSRSWRQIGGTLVVLSGTGASRTYIAPGTLAGVTLTFGYQVIDDSGGVSTEDTVTHVVLPATERAVIAGAEVPVQTCIVANGTLV